MAGSKLVFAGQYSADPASLAELIQGEQVTITAGVPTVWIGLLNWLEQNPRDLSSIRLITAGGSAVQRPSERRDQRARYAESEKASQAHGGDLLGRVSRRASSRRRQRNGSGGRSTSGGDGIMR